MKTNTISPLPYVIAMDGPAASGKSSVGQAVADALGYVCFDTGIMYRAVTCQALEEGLDINDEEAVSSLAERIAIDIQPASVRDGRKADVIINGQDRTWGIRDERVNRSVSEVSTYARVRRAMTEKQREIARNGKMVVLGRDIGTVVLPQAELKIYLDASVQARAKRRYAEEISRGKQTSLAEVQSSLEHRDRIDSSRALAPLKPAADAVIIQTDAYNQEQVVDLVLRAIKSWSESAK